MAGDVKVSKCWETVGISGEVFGVALCAEYLATLASLHLGLCVE